MSNLVTRWNPSQQAVVAQPLFRLFDTFFNDGGEDLATRTWTPPVDIQETDDAELALAKLRSLLARAATDVEHDTILREVDLTWPDHRRADAGAVHRSSKIRRVLCMP